MNKIIKKLLVFVVLFSGCSNDVYRVVTRIEKKEWGAVLISGEEVSTFVSSDRAALIKVDDNIKGLWVNKQGERIK